VLPQPWVKWAYQPAARRTFLARSCGPTRWHFSRRRVQSSCPSLSTTGQTRPGPGGRANGKSSGEPRYRAPARLRRPDQPCAAPRAGLPSREIDRSGAWDAGVASRRKVGAPVYAGPLPDRASFPEKPSPVPGPLPMTVAGAEETLRGHDLAIVIGAQICTASVPSAILASHIGVVAEDCAPITIARS